MSRTRRKVRSSYIEGGPIDKEDPSSILGADLHRLTMEEIEDLAEKIKHQPKRYMFGRKFKHIRALDNANDEIVVDDGQLTGDPLKVWQEYKEPVKAANLRRYYKKRERRKHRREGQNECESAEEGRMPSADGLGDEVTQ